MYGVYGRPAYDFVIYLASILANLGKRVLVMDYSKEKDIIRCYLIGEGEKEYFHIWNMDYVSVEENQSIDREQYDYIFEYFNSEKQDCLGEGSQYNGIFIITDFIKDNLSAAGKIMKRYRGDRYLILRDSCSKKIDMQHVFREFLQIEESVVLYWELELDYYDYTYRTTMTHEVWQGFQKLSKSYRLCLKKVVEIIACPSLEELKQAYKRAERGRHIESSFLE